jgi:hypothetical protein
MSNTFKSNSRFAALAEETNINNVFNKKDKSKKNESKNNESKNNESKNNESKKEGNQFTSDRFNTFNSYENRPRRPVISDFESIKNKELREKKEKERQFELNKIKEKETEKSLTIENFPDLLVKNTKNTNNNNNNNNDNKPAILQTGFIDKVKFVKQVTNVNKKVSHIKPGWIEIRKDLITGKLITTSNPIPGNTSDDDDNNHNDIKTLYALVTLHEKRTEEYIDLWGYDTWEKMFRFPNYDYEYFDKLDEKYEEEMEKAREEREREKNNNSDYEEY